MTTRTFNRVPQVFLLLTLLCALASPTPARADASTPRFEPGPCPPNTPLSYTIQCGYLVVPEDRRGVGTGERPLARTIRLAVAVIKSRAPNPAPDPLIILNGGPGGHALLDLTRFIATNRLLYANLNRDLIIFDQRGVGLSQPALECPELVPAILAQIRGQALTVAEKRAPHLACRDRWTGLGVDLAAYTTANSAADVNDLWHALGYEQVNLYGISYGTLLAETVMRDYPAGLRSVILDSAYPLEISLSADTAANMHRSLQRVFADCVADFLCNRLYPHLALVYLDLLNRLRTTPAVLTTPDPTTGEPFTFTFGPIELGDALRLQPARQIPAFIYDLHDGDYAVIVKARADAIKVTLQFGPPPGRAMASSVMCSQGMYSYPVVATEVATTFPESDWANYFNTQELTPFDCADWPTRGAPDARPAVSDLPTLILSGDYDATRSPAYDAIFAQDLSRAFIVTVPNVGHGVTGSGGPCVNDLARAFLNDPARQPDTACIPSTGQSLLDPRFVIRPAAMRLPVQVALGLLVIAIAWAAGQGLVTLFRLTRHVAWGFTWLSSFQAVGWRLTAGSALGGILAWLGARAGFLPIESANAVAVVLPVLAAVQAAFVFSPEDEPALEMTLALPRPVSWTLLERLTVLLISQSGIGLIASLLISIDTGEPLASAMARWLPLLILLSGLAVCVTLITRRVALSLVVVALVWFTFILFGDFMVERWAFAWPLHFYLAPDHAQYALNRWFLALLGVGLSAYAASALLRDEERVLLGDRKAKKTKTQIPNPNDQILIGETDSPLVTCHPSLVTQLLAMLRYEFLLQWRRPALIAVTGGLVTMPVFGLFISRAQFAGQTAALAAGSLSAEAARASVTATLIPFIWIGMWLVMMLLVPIVVADTVPKDRQFGMRELLDSLPLTTGTYLSGKLLSLWVSLLVSVVCAMLVGGLTWQFGVGAFNWEIFLEVWLVGGLGLALVNSGLSMLLAVGQPSNRRAVLVGVGFAAASLAMIGVVFILPGTFWQAMNLARPVLTLYYFLGWPGANFGESGAAAAGMQAIRAYAPRSQAWLSIGVGLLQVAAAYGLAWGWVRRRADKV